MDTIWTVGKTLIVIPFRIINVILSGIQSRILNETLRGVLTLTL